MAGEAPAATSPAACNISNSKSNIKESSPDPAQQQLNSSVDSGIAVLEAETPTLRRRQRLSQCQRILLVLQRDHLTHQQLRDRLSKLANKKWRKEEKDASEDRTCNVCCADLDLGSAKNYVTCCTCGKSVCRGPKCADWRPKDAKWECQLCQSSKESLAHTSSWVAEQMSFNQHKFVYPMRARSEVYIPIVGDGNDSSMQFESVSQIGQTANLDERAKIREYVEEIVAEMLGGNLDHIKVGQLSKSENYLPAIVNGQNNGNGLNHNNNNNNNNNAESELADISQTRLRSLIETIIAETLRNSSLSISGAVSEISLDTRSHASELANGNGMKRRHRTEHYFEPKIYQDLLATAVLNKIADKEGNTRLLAESTPDLSGRHIDENFNAEALSTTSGSSIEPRSDSSLTDHEIGLDNGKSKSLQTDLERESVLSDYIAAHMVPLPDFSASVTESEDDIGSISSGMIGDGNWEDNWLFKKKRSSATPSSIGMLVPAPTENVRAQIGDKTTDEISDLSEIGSDIEESSLDLLRCNDLNDRLLSQHLIGGQNTKLVLDELVDRTSLTSHTLLEEHEPAFTETTNEFVVSPMAVPSDIKAPSPTPPPPPMIFQDDLLKEEEPDHTPIAAEGETDELASLDGCTGFSTVEYIDEEQMHETVPSVIEILAAMALGPMLAVPASEQPGAMTPSEMHTLKELSDLALAEINARTVDLVHSHSLEIIEEENNEPLEIVLQPHLDIIQPPPLEEITSSTLMPLEEQDSVIQTDVVPPPPALELLSELEPPSPIEVIEDAELFVAVPEENVLEKQSDQPKSDQPQEISLGDGPSEPTEIDQETQTVPMDIPAPLEVPLESQPESKANETVAESIPDTESKSTGIVAEVLPLEMDIPAPLQPVIEIDQVVNVAQELHSDEVPQTEAITLETLEIVPETVEIVTEHQANTMTSHPVPIELIPQTESAGVEPVVPLEIVSEVQCVAEDPSPTKIDNVGETILERNEIVSTTPSSIVDPLAPPEIVSETQPSIVDIPAPVETVTDMPVPETLFVETIPEPVIMESELPVEVNVALDPPPEPLETISETQPTETVMVSEPQDIAIDSVSPIQVSSQTETVVVAPSETVPDPIEVVELAIPDEVIPETELVSVDIPSIVEDVPLIDSVETPKLPAPVEIPVPVDLIPEAEPVAEAPAPESTDASKISSSENTELLSVEPIASVGIVVESQPAETVAVDVPEPIEGGEVQDEGEATLEMIPQSQSIDVEPITPIVGSSDVENSLPAEVTFTDANSGENADIGGSTVEPKELVRPVPENIPSPVELVSELGLAEKDPPIVMESEHITPSQLIPEAESISLESVSLPESVPQADTNPATQPVAVELIPPPEIAPENAPLEASSFEETIAEEHIIAEDIPSPVELVVKLESEEVDQSETLAKQIESVNVKPVDHAEKVTEPQNLAVEQLQAEAQTDSVALETIPSVELIPEISSIALDSSESFRDQHLTTAETVSLAEDVGVESPNSDENLPKIEEPLASVEAISDAESVTVDSPLPLPQEVTPQSDLAIAGSDVRMEIPAEVETVTKVPPQPAETVPGTQANPEIPPPIVDVPEVEVVAIESIAPVDIAATPSEVIPHDESETVKIGATEAKDVLSPERAAVESIDSINIVTQLETDRSVQAPLEVSTEPQAMVDPPEIKDDISQIEPVQEEPLKKMETDSRQTEESQPSEIVEDVAAETSAPEEVILEEPMQPVDVPKGVSICTSTPIAGEVVIVNTPGPACVLEELPTPLESFSDTETILPVEAIPEPRSEDLEPQVTTEVISQIYSDKEWSLANVNSAPIELPLTAQSVAVESPESIEKVTLIESVNVDLPTPVQIKAENVTVNPPEFVESVVSNNTVSDERAITQQKHSVDVEPSPPEEIVTQADSIQVESPTPAAIVQCAESIAVEPSAAVELVPQVESSMISETESKENESVAVELQEGAVEPEPPVDLMTTSEVENETPAVQIGLEGQAEAVNVSNAVESNAAVEPVAVAPTEVTDAQLVASVDICSETVAIDLTESLKVVSDSDSVVVENVSVTECIATDPQGIAEDIEQTVTVEQLPPVEVITEINASAGDLPLSNDDVAGSAGVEPLESKEILDQSEPISVDPICPANHDPKTTFEQPVTVDTLLDVPGAVPIQPQSETEHLTPSNDAPKSEVAANDQLSSPEIFPETQTVQCSFESQKDTESDAVLNEVVPETETIAVEPIDPAGVVQTVAMEEPSLEPSLTAERNALEPLESLPQAKSVTEVLPVPTEIDSNGATITGEPLVAAEVITQEKPLTVEPEETISQTESISEQPLSCENVIQPGDLVPIMLPAPSIVETQSVDLEPQPPEVIPETKLDTVDPPDTIQVLSQADSEISSVVLEPKILDLDSLSSMETVSEPQLQNPDTSKEVVSESTDVESTAPVKLISETNNDADDPPYTKITQSDSAKGPQETVSEPQCISAEPPATVDDKTVPVVKEPSGDKVPEIHSDTMETEPPEAAAVPDEVLPEAESVPICLGNVEETVTKTGEDSLSAEDISKNDVIMPELQACTTVESTLTCDEAKSISSNDAQLATNDPEMEIKMESASAVEPAAEGSIAEREVKKWYNAVEMPNNPYAPEALKQRISGTQERYMDVPNISPSAEHKALASALTENPDPPSPKTDYKRYSRDYYINNAPTPTDSTGSGKAAAPISAEDVEDIVINEAQKASKPATEQEPPQESVFKAVPVQILDESLDSQSNPSLYSLQTTTTTTSDESDTVRIYDFNKQETTVIKAVPAEQQPSTSTTSSMESAQSATPSVSSIDSSVSKKRERPVVLQFGPGDSAPTIGSPASTPTRGSTPPAFRFLQPKRRLIDPSQVLSVDEDDVPEPTTPASEKPVIEDEVAHSMPSVKALAQAFLLTSKHTQPQRRWRAKVRIAAPPDTPDKPNTSLAKRHKLEHAVSMAEVADESTIASDLSSLETDPSIHSENTPPIASPASPVPVRHGFLRSNIAFFENLKFK
ncbi:mucin-17 isoform X2 [Drosophila eugracilis]|uniref:mucin-17 isoform X2 n=1 Tax=Drosophila eugracilis TaxID=29029 RepID=UPI0007E633EC|nr:mucin-17 isoform X2 [Drosophila eugracilis]